jgi:hypothetical protein
VTGTGGVTWLDVDPAGWLEHHGARQPDGLYARVGQRLLALTAAIWHNTTIGAPRTRSLINYDHWESLI